MTIAPSAVSAHGRLLGRVTFPRAIGMVPAGGPLPQLGEMPIDGRPTTFYRFLVFDDFMTECGVVAGDTIMIDTSPVGYWRDSDYDGEIVLMSSHVGPLIGRYLSGSRYDILFLLDRSGDMIVRTPEMEIIGIARFLHRPVRSEGAGDSFG